MKFTVATADDLPDWLEMALALWPYESKEDMESLFHTLFASENDEMLIARTDDGIAVGFANISIRKEYVEGSNSSPVGYIEGIYVKPEFRKQGIARKFIELAEEWSRNRGCTELGSDTEIENVESREFHRHIGFGTESRIVHFIKGIKPNLKIL
ncbi:MAG: aminoglycoside 6'-N-acetyltransferase [Candidatus Kapaibacterium sp.]